MLTYEFDNLPTNYNGTLTVGRHFDIKYWPKDDRANQVPFSPKFYNEVGQVKITNGIVTEYKLESNSEKSK